MKAQVSVDLSHVTEIKLEPQEFEEFYGTKVLFYGKGTLIFSVFCFAAGYGEHKQPVTITTCPSTILYDKETLDGPDQSDQPQEDEQPHEVDPGKTIPL